MTPPDQEGIPGIPEIPENRQCAEGTVIADRATQVQRSALWAAYGDALGWISELTDEAGLRRRTGGKPLCRPIAWKRRIGGRAGITTMLPQGCYSDDTQLRLATGRAIRPEGFDVEAFAKVELPVWLSYALGGGKSTSAAAQNLVKPRTAWFANRFKGWTMSGGNGAAMRIQPHVWAARAPDNAETFLADVVRNAICTHSHPNGLLGAVLHALALAHAIARGRCPDSDDLFKAVDTAAGIPDTIHSDADVGSLWRSAFEQESGAFDQAWARATAECREAIESAASNPANTTCESRYADIVDRLQLRDPAQRGCGMLTAVAAVALTWCEPRPEEALRIAANAIGTDTDTIATMAGAVLGVVAKEEPPVEVLDAALFRSEGDRLAAIAAGDRPPSHQYPDLLHWHAPRARADALIRLENDGLQVRGLGPAEVGRDPLAPSKHGFRWQWLELRIGQTVLIKRREVLLREDDASNARPAGRPANHGSPATEAANEAQVDMHQAGKAHPAGTAIFPRAPRTPSEPVRPFDPRQVLDYVAAHKDDDRAVGRAFRRIVNEGAVAAFLDLADIVRQPAAGRISASEAPSPPPKA